MGTRPSRVALVVWRRVASVRVMMGEVVEVRRGVLWVGLERAALADRWRRASQEPRVPDERPAGPAMVDRVVLEGRLAVRVQEEMGRNSEMGLRDRAVGAVVASYSSQELTAVLRADCMEVEAAAPQTAPLDR